MINRIRNLWGSKPLLIILLLAAFFRLIAAIFSKGYGMSDDHFLVIELAQHWVDGHHEWFQREHPFGHSLVYPGLHYILFYLLEKLRILDPQFKMLIVRLIHALYSMLIVWFGYLITGKLSDEKNAKQVGLILALLWILPVLSVRNLIEIVCIPPAMIGFYFALKAEESEEKKWWIIAGAMFGLSFAFRYQVSFIIFGVGLVLLFTRKIIPLFLFSVGFLISAFTIQGTVDWIAWGYPFASFYRYLVYNIQSRYNYLTGPWYQYLELIFGVFILPISLMLFWGFLRTWKKYALIFIPTALFLLFHSYFPNKQERFILPILPYIPILGIIGWNDFVNSSKFWQNRQKLLRAFWIWFWIVNCLMLLIVSPTYTKKNRVETLYYLSKKDDVNGVIFESFQRTTPNPPKFYLNKNIEVYRYPRAKTNQDLLNEIGEKDQPFPNYIIFLGETGIEHRVNKFKSDFSVELEPIVKIYPGFIDDILYRLNPEHNRNQTSYIYTIYRK
ncbi:MAG: glycosyltransferase family 39 protein [bacterium]|nr:MAG: glycosyltransferase family 39 protein [bacterium]